MDIQGFVKENNARDVEEARRKIIEYLRQLLGVSKELSDFEVVLKEAEPERVMGLLPLVEHLAGETEAMAVNKERTMAIVRELRQGRGGGRHPLAGLMGGPSGAEGGPAELQAVTKQATNDALEILLDAITNNLAEVQVSDKVKVLLNLDGTFFRVVYSGPTGPRSFSQQGSWPIWAAEANHVVNAARLLSEALAFEGRAAAISKETKRHPLEGLGWLGASDGKSQVVTGRG